MIEIQEQQWNDFTRYVIIETQDGLIGSVQVELYPTPQEYGYTAFLYSLWVNDESRHAGHAKLLIEAAENIARQHGHESIALEWWLKDTPIDILKWYLRLGYEERVFDGHGEYSLLSKPLKGDTKHD